MTPERVTPQQAQEMLDRVKEGCPLPWEIFALETIEEDPREVKNVRCNEPGCDGHLAYSMDYDGTTEIDPDAIELVAAAPALAQLVANMRYEYAVQVPVATAVPGEPVWRFFVRRGTNGGAILTAVPGLAKWETSQRDAKKRAELHELTGYRIVRRLVGESEVVE